MKHFISLLLCSVLLIGCSSTQTSAPEQTSTEQPQESGSEPTSSESSVQIKYALGDVIVRQREVDQIIDEAMENTSYTLEKPHVMVNPYFIAPQTALVIFQTPEETEITLDVNGEFQTTFERSTKHAISVYGMYADYNNQITLKDETGKKTVLEIPLEAYTGAVVTVEQANEKLPFNAFYMVSPDYENTSAYDEEGRLLWYLATGDNEGAMVFLDNGHFLMSDPNQGTSGIRINYSGFYEMDFLGKIHTQYIPEYGYHHEIEYVNDGEDFLLSGSDENSQFLQGVVYIVDAKTLLIQQELDLSEVYRTIDPEWTEALGDAYNVVINGISYNEKTHDLVISPRTLDMLICVNMDTQEVQWILADPASLPETFAPYLLTPLNETRYPRGQHNCVFLDDTGTLLSYHDNDISINKDVDQTLSNYLDRYSSNQILRIDPEQKTVETLWQYQTSYEDGTKVFSKMSGSFEILEDGHSLLSYGSAVRPEAYEHPETSQIMDNLLTNGLMVELDENDEVIWQATFPGVMHKVYKSYFYKGVTPNYTHGTYQKIDGQYFEKHQAHQVAYESLKEKFENAEPFEGEVDVFINRMIVSLPEYEESQKIDVYFVSGEEVYMKTYKNKGEMPGIVNSGRYGVQLTMPEGTYTVYVCINGVYYDPQMEIVFE